MKVRVFTPTEVVLDQEAAHVTAEDPSGSLGIRPGHTPLVTPLVPGIVQARGTDARETYVAVNGGVMVVDGDTVDIVSRQAVKGDDLQQLTETALADFETEEDDARSSRVAFEKMRVAFVRHVLDANRSGGPR